VRPKKPQNVSTVTLGTAGYVRLKRLRSANTATRGFVGYVMSKNVAIDFDGVIHSYISPWTSRSEVNDPPVPGAFQFIKELLDLGVKVYIFSVRCQSDNGIKAIKDWLIKYNQGELISKLHFTATKPSAVVYLDDRGWRFNGTFPDIKELLESRPWNKK